MLPRKAPLAKAHSSVKEHAMSARFPVQLDIVHVGEVTEESQVHYLLLDQGHCRPMYPESPVHMTLAGVSEWLESQGCGAIKLYSEAWGDVLDEENGSERFLGRRTHENKELQPY